MKGNNGEHPFGDNGQLISLVSFALVMAIFIFYNHIASYEEKLLEDKK